MAEQQEKTKAADPGDLPVSAATGIVAAGRRQAGEKVHEGLISTRVPRSPGEPAADDIADGGVGQAQRTVAKQIAEETERGFRGENTDVTPNFNYTLRGVGQGLPTPETLVHTPKGA